MKNISELTSELFLKKTKKTLDYHIVNTTAQAAVYTPLFSVLEVSPLVGMSDDVSLNARLLAVGISISGMGYVLAKSRDISRNIFNITQESNEKVQTAHDSLQLAALNLVTAPVFYMVAGASNSLEIAKATGMAVIGGAVTGPFMGYSMDMFQDLMRLQDSPRIPKKISQLGKKSKLGLAAFLTSASIGLSAGIYELTYDSFNGENYLGYVEEQKN